MAFLENINFKSERKKALLIEPIAEIRRDVNLRYFCLKTSSFVLSGKVWKTIRRMPRMVPAKFKWFVKRFFFSSS